MTQPNPNAPVELGNREIIYGYLTNEMGFSPAVAAGIMGNFQVESKSTWNPAVLNPNEQAIGIAQWEGTRRTALQKLARQSGRSETDLDIQLEFMRQELLGGQTTPIYDQLKKLRGGDSVKQAATIWQSQYERSTPDSLPERISDALAIYTLIIEDKLKAVGENIKGKFKWATPGHWTSVSGAAIPDPPSDLLKYGKITGTNTGTGTDYGSGITLTSAGESLGDKQSGAVAGWLKDYWENMDISPQSEEWLFGYTAQYQPKQGSGVNILPDPGQAKDATPTIPGVIEGLTNAVAGPLEAVGRFFEALLWIFNVDHFMKFLLYVFGTIAVGIGLGLISFGAGVTGEEGG